MRYDGGLIMQMLQLNTLKHLKVWKCIPVVFSSVTFNPYLAASPDGLIHCKDGSLKLIEVNCLFKHHESMIACGCMQ